MAFRWDNIEILRAIDRIQGETYHGGPIRGMSGLQLMEQVSGKAAVDQRLTRGFVQEIHIARDLGLLAFRVQGDFRPGQPDTDPDWYVRTCGISRSLSLGRTGRVAGRLPSLSLTWPRTTAVRLATSSSGRSLRRSPGSTPWTRSPFSSRRRESLLRRCRSPRGRGPATRTRSWLHCGGGDRRAAG
jgi:hypothetical protein